MRKDCRRCWWKNCLLREERREVILREMKSLTFLTWYLMLQGLAHLDRPLARNALWRCWQMRALRQAGVSVRLEARPRKAREVRRLWTVCEADMGR